VVFLYSSLRVSSACKALFSSIFCNSPAPSYLQPISQSMQKTYRGVYPYWRFSQPKEYANDNQSMHRLQRALLAKVSRKYRSDTTIGSTPQAVGGRRLSWSTEVFQLTPRLHQTHLLWEPSSRETGMAASFRERLRA
jgi:hypothetical protein